jgi:acyl carrier protein
MNEAMVHLGISETIRRLAANGDLPCRLATEHLTPATEVAALGLDSLGMLTFVDELGTKFNLQLPDEGFEPNATLSDIVQLLLSKSLREE